MSTIRAHVHNTSTVHQKKEPLFAQDAGIYTSDAKAAAAGALTASDLLPVASKPAENAGIAAGSPAADAANGMQASGPDTPPPSSPPSHQPSSPARATASSKLPDAQPAQIKTSLTSPTVATTADTLLAKVGSPRSSHSADTGAGFGDGGSARALSRLGSGSSLDARSDTSSWAARASTCERCLSRSLDV